MARALHFYSKSNYAAKHSVESTRFHVRYKRQKNLPISTLCRASASTHKVSFSFCNSSTCLRRTAITSLEAAASSLTAWRSSFILKYSRSVTASVEDRLKKDPFSDAWPTRGGVWPPPEVVEVNPAVLLDFLSLRDLRILLKACNKQKIIDSYLVKMFFPRGFLLHVLFFWKKQKRIFLIRVVIIKSFAIIS